MSTATLPEIMPADAAERSAALNVAQSFLVEAPAGSGKTGLLVQRLLRLLCRVDRPEAVLALTFTNKATAEMRERVLRALDMVARDPATLSEFDRTTREAAAALLQHEQELGWNLRENSHRLNIRTIDSLCGEIARSLPLSSGPVGQMQPVEDAMPLYRRAARAVMLRLGGADDRLNGALRNVLLHRDADLHNCESLLANMLATREQWQRLVPLSQNELTDDYLDREVKSRLDRTLERIVCSELAKLQELFPPAELHDLAELAAQLAHADGHGAQPNPLAGCARRTMAPGAESADAEHWAMLARLLLNASSPHAWRRSLAVNHLGIKLASQHKKRLTALLESLSAHDALHAQLCELRNLPPASMPPEDWRMTKSLFHLLHYALIELQSIFRQDDVCDFPERSIAARAALVQRHGDPGFELQHLLVDEMQDTSSAQYKLLEALTQDWDGTSRTVFLVGDPKQSIYLFRQARVERFVESLNTGRLGTVPLQVLRLSTNFRSAGPLVDRFNQLFGPVFDQSSGGIRYIAAVAAKADEPGTLHWHVDPLWGEHGKDSRRDSQTQVRREQAEHLVHTIHQLRKDAPLGKPPSIAVLVRSREHTAQITRLLGQAGIPFRGVELERLNERAEVLDVLALTRALLHPADRVAWLATLRAPWCGATLVDLHHLAAGEERGSSTRAPRNLFRERAAGLSADARTRVLRTLDILDTAVANRGRMPIAELVHRTSLALGCDLFQTETERKNVRRFLELLEKSEAELQPVNAEDLKVRLARLFAEPDTTPGAVDIMTIHKAKGLEWDVVFVPEFQRSAGRDGRRLLDWLELPRAGQGQAGVLLAPIPPRGEPTAELGCFVQTAQRRQQEAELARLLYVVVTRARRELHLYAAPELKKDSDEVTRKPGTLLAAAWPGAGDTIQHLATDKLSGRELLLTAVEAGVEGLSSEVINLADLRRVSPGFDPAALQQKISVPWLHAAAQPAVLPSVLEDVHRHEGGLATRAVGNAVHLFLDLLANRIAANPACKPSTLLAEVEGWSNRIRAVLRDAGTYGAALDRDVATVMLALRNTLFDPLGYWLLQPHPGAISEQPLTEESSGRTLRLDRSFLAGAAPGTNGQQTLWIVDYKTARPADLPLASFLQNERERYAPQLRNYARLRARRPGTPAQIMLALYYPLAPALDAWAADLNTPALE